MKKQTVSKPSLKVGVKSSVEHHMKPAANSVKAKASVDHEKPSDHLPATSSVSESENVCPRSGSNIKIRFFPYSGTQEERNDISCVLPEKLFLTNFRGVGDADKLEALGIRHIVCANEQDNEFVGRFNYFNIDTLEDQEDHDASKHFLAVSEFTDTALAKGGAVCFHCAAGISRSSTLVIAYLMASLKISLFDAFTHTFKARRVIWPNRSFMRQLIEHEHSLQLKRIISGTDPSITLDEWDAWTASDEDSYFAAMEACIQERSDSLRGRESVQFRTYLEKVGHMPSNVLPPSHPQEGDQAD